MTRDVTEHEALFLGHDGQVRRGKTRLAKWQADLLARHQRWGLTAMPLVVEPGGGHSRGSRAGTGNHKDPGRTA